MLIDGPYLNFSALCIGAVEINYEELLNSREFQSSNSMKTFDLDCGGQLTIQIQGYAMNIKVLAFDLKDMDFLGTSDPYFVAYLNDKEVHRSETATNDESVSYHPFPMTCDSLSDVLTINFFDEDKGADDPIGNAVYECSELLESGIDRKPLELNGEFGGTCEIKVVEKLKELDIDLENCKSTCAERDQPVIYEQDLRVKNGGFYASLSIIDNLKAGCVKFVRNVLAAGKQEMKLHLLESCIYLSNIDNDEIEWVVLFDKTFLMCRKDETHFIFENSDRKMQVTVNSDVDGDELYRQVLEHFENDPNLLDMFPDGCEAEEDNDVRKFHHIPGNGYALCQPGKARWFNQGRDYFWYLSDLLTKAKREIYITDWCLHQETTLRRPFEKHEDPDYEDWSVEKIIRKKADEGVNIYILLFGNFGSKVLGLGADRVLENFNDHKNIAVCNHGAALAHKFLWSHHEKLCIIDQCVAFVGGIDLCAGRYVQFVYESRYA